MNGTVTPFVPKAQPQSREVRLRNMLLGDLLDAKIAAILVRGSDLLTAGDRCEIDDAITHLNTVMQNHIGATS